MSLQRQHQALLRKIASKQKDVERLKRTVQQAEQQLLERVEPIAARCRRTNEELWNMFEALLASAPTKRARRAVREVFHALISQGVLLPVDAESDAEFGHDDNFEDGCGDHGDFDDGDHQGPDDGRRARNAGDSARARPRFDHGGYSAAPRGAEPGRNVLKAVFKRLTLAFHPDRTQDADEKQARTALMQNVTRAYQLGDLASLLRLEKKTAVGSASESAPDQAAQCLALQQTIDELRVQLSELKNEARQLERAEALQFFDAGAPGQGKSLDRLVRSVEAELDELTRIRDFVEAFREKRLTLDEFLCGPVFHFGGAEFDFDDLLRAQEVEAAASDRKGRRGAPRKRGRR